MSAPQSVQAAAYQLTLDRRINDKVMKPGWFIVLTGNRMTDGGVVFKMPTPLANRLVHLTVETDVDVWRRWAMNAGVEDSLIAFISLRPDLLNTFDDHVKNKKSGDAFATERSWHIVSDLSKANAPEDVFLALSSGAVGDGPAAEYYGFRRTWQNMPSIDAILLDPSNAPVPEDAATQYAVAVALAANSTKDNFDGILTYAARFHDERGRAELTVLTVKDALYRKGELANTKAFSHWAVNNVELLK